MAVQSAFIGYLFEPFGADDGIRRFIAVEKLRKHFARGVGVDFIPGKHVQQRGKPCGRYFCLIEFLAAVFRGGH